MAMNCFDNQKRGGPDPLDPRLDPPMMLVNVGSMFIDIGVYNHSIVFNMCHFVFIVAWCT